MPFARALHAFRHDGSAARIGLLKFQAPPCGPGSGEGVDTVTRWVCEIIGFSGCNGLSPADVALFAWAITMAGLIVAVLLVGFVLGRH
jgi:hypothetical protein